SSALARFGPGVGRHNALRGADAAAPALRSYAAPGQEPGRCARGRICDRRAHRRRPRRPGCCAPGTSPHRACGSCADGPGERRLHGRPDVETSQMAWPRALADARFAGSLAVRSLASLLFGILSVLAPLRLAGAGWGAGAIGAIWLGGAAVEAVESPLLGRLSDARGPLLPVRLALASGLLISLGLSTGAGPLLYAPLVLAASASYGALFTPAFALIADGAERAGLAQGMAFGLMNAAWAVGAAVGPAAAGAIAAATGDWIPFLLAAAACAAA